MSKHDGTSHLPGKVVKKLMITPGDSPGENFADTVQVTAQRARSTEIAAIERVTWRAKAPSYRAWQVNYWMRIASQPASFPGVVGKPDRAQSGQQLLEWVGNKVGLSLDEVEMLLEDVELYMKTNE